MARRTKYYSLREVKRQGKKDGRSWRWKFMPPTWPFWESKESDPPVNQKEHSQYEAKLISIAHENLERIGIEWSKEDEKLTTEYCNAKSEKERLDEKIDEEMEEHKDAITAYEKAKKVFFDFSPRWIPLFLYWLIFGFVVLGEGIFNYYVFQLFGQEPIETLLMAGAIIVTVVFASEVVGHNLKKEKKAGLDRFLNGLMVTVVVIVLVGIAVLRETFLEASKATGIFDIPLNPSVATGIFITFNLVFFVGLTYLSYTEARKNPEDYRKAKKAYKEALKAVKEKGVDVEEIAEELAEAEERFNNAYSAREHTFEIYRHRAEEERDIWVRYIRGYRHANMGVRKDKTLPESFKVDPETLIKISPVLETLDWSCPGEEREEKEK
jgi:tetratricopeptide (TPR) repeat protein